MSKVCKGSRYLACKANSKWVFGDAELEKEEGRRGIERDEQMMKYDECEMNDVDWRMRARATADGTG